MSKIKKRGLDYFPLTTDFLQSRLVRRIMKREGDGAFAVLMGAISYIYADEGYYVKADDYFYEDLAACLYEKTCADVRRILALAVEYGLFDARLFAEQGILTSAEMQRQYLFSAKRRKTSEIEPAYSLVEASEPQEDVDILPPSAGINAEKTTQNATSGAHSIAQHSIAQHKKEDPLLLSSPKTGGTEEDAAGVAAEEEYLRKIDGLRPPEDAMPRNYEGLLLNLRQHRIPPKEQYALVLKSNFGVIGHPLWKGFGVLRTSHGKIRNPGRYLLSLCK